MHLGFGRIHDVLLEESAGPTVASAIVSPAVVTWAPRVNQQMVAKAPWDPISLVVTCRA